MMEILIQNISNRKTNCALHIQSTIVAFVLSNDGYGLLASFKRNFGAWTFPKSPNLLGNDNMQFKLGLDEHGTILFSNFPIYEPTYALRHYHNR